MPSSNLGFVAATESNELGAHPPAPGRRVARSPSARCSTGCMTSRSDRVLLSFLDSDWSHELVRLARGGCGRLLARVTLQVGTTATGIFSTRRGRCRTLSPGRARCARCSISGRIMRRQIRPRAAQPPAARRRSTAASCWSEATPARSSSSMSRTSAAGLRRSGDYWLSRTIGLRVEDQPDYAYGKWVAEAYRDVLSTRRARARRRRRGHHLAAAAARELPLPAAGRAVRGDETIQPCC